MKLTDPIPQSSINRFCGRMMILAFALIAIAGVLRLLGSGANTKFAIAGIGCGMVAMWVDFYVEPDAARDDRAVEYNKVLIESDSDLPPKQVGTHRWAYIALALVLFVGFPLIFLADKLGL